MKFILLLLYKRAYIRNFKKNQIVENRFHSFTIILYNLLNITSKYRLSNMEK